LQVTSDSLGSNVQEVQRVGGDLREIQQRVDGLSERVQQLGLDNDAARNIQGLEIAVSWMLIWLLLQSFAWLALGIGILLGAAWRQRSRREVATRDVTLAAEPTRPPA
jgi:hypothetical protein